MNIAGLRGGGIEAEKAPVGAFTAVEARDIYHLVPRIRDRGTLSPIQYPFGTRHTRPITASGRVLFPYPSFLISISAQCC